MQIIFCTSFVLIYVFILVKLCKIIKLEIMLRNFVCDNLSFVFADIFVYSRLSGKRFVPFRQVYKGCICESKVNEK